MSTFVEKILNESKQVGIVYHFTSYESFKSILKENVIRSGERDTFGVSVTRDKNYHLSRDRSQDDIQTSIRITLDGNKLSNKYKIVPYSYDSIGRVGNEMDESQEVVLTKKGIINVKNYILGISVFAEDDGFGDAGNLDVLREILSLCKAQNIKVHVDPYVETSLENFDEDDSGDLQFPKNPWDK